jgi:hypothetical protein
MTAKIKGYSIIAQAGIAVAMLTPRIAHAVAKADPTDHDGALRQIREAAGHARELATRLEIAELDLASRPIQPAASEEAA